MTLNIRCFINFVTLHLLGLSAHIDSLHEGECSPLESNFGGDWHCYPPVEDIYQPVEDGTQCVLGCYETDIDAVRCSAGQWLPGPPGVKMCNLCPPLPHLDNTTLTCSDDYIGPNTTCNYKCDSEHFYFTGHCQYFCGQNGKWSQEPDFACHPRNMEESVLIIGGLLPSMWPEFISSVDKFDGAVLDNSSVPVLPAGTAYLTAVGLGSMAVTCFGEMSCHDRSDRSDCHDRSDSCEPAECLIWDHDGAWFNPREDGHYIPPVNVFRSKAMAASFNNTVWVIGGKHENYSTIVSSTVEIFNPYCLADPDCLYWSRGPEIPNPDLGLFDACAVTYNEALYLSGGSIDSYRPPYVTDQFVKFDLSSNSWLTLPSLPGGEGVRYGHGCAVHEDRIFISGGYSHYDGRLGQVDIYTPATMEWSLAGSLIIPRNNHQMVNLNGFLTVMGGYGDITGWAPTDQDTIEEYHPDIQQWIVRNITLSLPRRSFGTALIKN